MSDVLLKAFDTPANETIPDLRIGDDITVHLRIVEGSRERIQLVRGTVIRMQGGENNRSSPCAVLPPMASASSAASSSAPP
jgi:large subunit ribosomal protein L19